MIEPLKRSPYNYIVANEYHADANWYGYPLNEVKTQTTQLNINVQQVRGSYLVVTF